MNKSLSSMPQAGASRKREVPEGLKEYTDSREVALAAFTRSGTIAPLWHGLTDATDKLLKGAAVKRGLTLLAVGGYGRRELYPYSDVDVLVLLPEKGDGQEGEEVVELLQQLWDVDVPVSHAVRSLRATIDAAKADHTIATALMDARYVTGDRKQYVALKHALKREVYGSNKRAFIEAKLAERDKRHEKWVDSRFVLEPHVKDGKGGLRDLQALTWLARYCYGVTQAADLVRPDLLTSEERSHTRDAYLFFAKVRAYIHTLSGRADERLTFDLQTDIAERLKFPGKTKQEKAEHFMQQYFSYTRHVGTLTRIFCAQLEEENLRSQHKPPVVQEAMSRDLPAYLALDNGRLNFSKKANFSKYPEQMIGLFAVAQTGGLDIHPQAHLALTRALPRHGKKLPENEEANRLLLAMLLSPKAQEVTLRRMNEMNVLAAIVPEFAGISGQMQYDGYHTFTVDEHTLVAIGNLAAIERGLWAEHFPLSTAVAEEVSDRAPLYLAVLCHDIAKGQGGGHAGKGEEITKRIAKRLGLTKAQSELAAWLVKHHLILSEAAFKRDLDDAKTIADFVAIVQSPERLRLLLLVTVADIKAVGPTIWNGWKGSLMRELYTRAMTLMGVGTIHQKVEPAEFSGALAAWEAAPGKPAIIIKADTFRAITEITCCLQNHPQLFRMLAGVMALIGASIVSARISVMKDNLAVASIGIQDLNGHAFDEQERLKKLPKLLMDGLAGKLAFDEELPRRKLLKRGREVAITPAAFVDNQVSAESSVIEVNAKDRLGLLYDILGALDACQLTVVTAHIATYGQKAVDVFYVKDAYGHKVTHPAKLAQVQKALTEYVAKH